MSENATRKADVVADDLLRRIVGGELSTGSLLPRENELADEYGVNRSVVREAIKLLEVHRLVRPRRRRGTEVLDPQASLSAEVLRAMLCPAPGRVDVSVLEDLLEVRADLDERMVALAAARRTAADRAAISAAQQVVGEAFTTGDPQVYSRALEAFTLALARATGNRLFVMLIHWHARILAELPALFGLLRRPTEQHLQGLGLLADLVRAGDVEGARSLVRAYHAWATPNLLEAARRLDPAEEA